MKLLRRVTPFALALSLLASAQSDFTAKSVLGMKKAGLSDSVMMATINSQPGKIPYTTDDLAALKAAGVSDEVMGAMIMHSGPTAAASAPAPSGKIVDEIGSYYQDPKSMNWTQMSSEIVNFKTGGVMKSLLTNGIVKGDLNGHVDGRVSSLHLVFPVALLIYVPEGTDPNEYQLLRLHVNSDNREFRSHTGGVFHASSGAVKDQVIFKAEKLAPRTYKIVLDRDAGPGEYGLLPPGSMASSNGASAGKIYTFSVLE